MENIDAFLTDIAEVLEEPKGALTDSYALTDDKWTSLAVISAIALIDEHFGVTVEGNALGRARTMAEVLDLVRARKMN